MNYAYVVLLPKRIAVKKISKFIPISLLNVIYKNLAKVLTTRLNAKLSCLVDPVQAEFIQGRYTMDGVVTAQETIFLSL